ncbi:MAG TPA: polyprenyl synthetase family protein [Candidatus Polarisedimenticolia bacterium]|nr:polyprenyl synthetase family protein [Candidatus Polarisedimenticolia bacterium]
MTDLASRLRPTPTPPAHLGPGAPGLPAILALVADKLALVEEDCRRNLRSEVGVIDELGRYLADGGGKRVRPILLLLSTKMCGYQGDRDVLFASVFEFIHTATLVHDDVIDEADRRRGRGSLNARWGNGLTVLLGDYLYIKSMNMALEADDIRIIKILASITLKMIEGELIADRRRWDIHLTEREHLEIIRRKTAYLFSGCGRVAGVLSGVALERVEALAEYGMNLGMAFQIVDDLLDFTADEKVLGKPVASDLKEGKLTLPLIYLLEKGDPTQRALVQAVLDERDFKSVPRGEIVAMLRSGQTLQRARDLALAYARRAKESLAVFEPGPARAALQALPDFVVSREY